MNYKQNVWQYQKEIDALEKDIILVAKDEITRRVFFTPGYQDKVSEAFKSLRAFRSNPGVINSLQEKAAVEILGVLAELHFTRHSKLTPPSFVYIASLQGYYDAREDHFLVPDILRDEEGFWKSKSWDDVAGFKTIGNELSQMETKRVQWRIQE